VVAHAIGRTGCVEVAPAVQGIDLFNIAGRSISGWIKSLKTGTAFHVRQLFCSQLEECLLLWLEYHPQVPCYARGDIGPSFATAYDCLLPRMRLLPLVGSAYPILLSVR
jgi:hypothetical protein